MAVGGYREAGVTGNVTDYLRRKGGLISFSANMDPSQGAYEGAKGLSAIQFRVKLLEIQRAMSLEMATSAAKTMSKWLSPGDPKRIGVTGAASKNLIVKDVQEVSGSGEATAVTAYVVEGNLTEANKYIRMGTKPKIGKAKKAQYQIHEQRNAHLSPDYVRPENREPQTNPVIENLSAWARAKGLKPRMPGPRLHKGRTFGWKKKPFGANNMTSRGPEKPADRWNKMIWAVWHGMMRSGTSKAYKERWGTPRFDYPKWYAQGEGGKGRNIRSVWETMIRRGDILSTRGSGRGHGTVETSDATNAYANILDVTYSYIRTEFRKNMKAFQSRQNVSKLV